MRRAPAFRRPRFAALLRDRRGVGAIEFALIAPLMIALYLGSTELTLAWILNRKVEHAAATVNDLVTQSQSYTKAEIDGILNVADTIVQPYSAAPLEIKVTGIDIDDAGNATVGWSRARNASEDQVGAAYALPAAYASLKSGFLVVSTTSYEYQPLIGSGVLGTVTMGGRTFFRQRQGDRVECSDCTGGAGQPTTGGV